VVKKVCSKCGELKEFTEFNKDKTKKDGLKGYCRACASAENRRRRLEDPEKEKERCRRWRLNNKEKLRQSKHEYYCRNCDRIRTKISRYQAEHPEKVRIWARSSSRAWYHRNRDKACAQSKVWRLKNKDKVRAMYNQWISDPSRAAKYRLIKNIRSAIRLSLMNGCKFKFEEVVGFSIQQLKEHLESQFCQGMSWENMGQWHIDHIKPVVLFDIDSMDSPDMKVCWNLSNLQPLWGIDNIRKHAKWSK
jgi:hypothetical protein